ncbi:MAG: tetratricopeptide repeat protein [Vicinamibacterales bacterium]
MQRLFRAATLVLVASLSLAFVGCGRYSVSSLRARKAFKEGNNYYVQQDYAKAAERYQETIANDPEFTAAYFYLANSYDNLYKPSRKGEPANDELLTKAVQNYKLAAEKEQDPKMRKLALEFLVAAYGPDKLADPGQAEPIILKMIELDPSDAANYFALAKMYEDNGLYDQAEEVLLKAKSVRPRDPDVYGQLAGFYNRLGEFEKTMEAFQSRVEIQPDNPENYYTLATYYWDKAFRDTKLKNPEKMDYVTKGLQSVDKAINLKPDYAEALVYKNLLLRLQANLETDPSKQQALLKEADALRSKAEDIRKKRAAGIGD